jgi:hypothetical protein
MDKKIKIIFVRILKSSFIQKDLELLRKHFDIKVVDFVLSRKNLKGSLATVFGMVKGVIWADVTFSWFADTRTFWIVRLPKNIGKEGDCGCW